MERSHLDTEQLWLWVVCSCLAATACLTKVTTSNLGWVDHRRDDGQVLHGRVARRTRWHAVRCRLPYRLPVQARWPWLAQTLIADVRKPGAKSRDTSGPGHDWIIEGTLAGVIQRTDLLLATRNVTGARAFIPISKEVADFTETQRVQRNSVLTGGGGAGLFYANRGAKLLAPAYGGQGLPRGCLVYVRCGTPGFPVCCTNPELVWRCSCRPCT